MVGLDGLNSLFAGNALFGLLAAAAWGVGDFSGGMGVKSAGVPDGAGPASTIAALRVVIASHVASFSVLLTVALLRGDARPHGLALACGLAAGVAGGLSLTCFYMALARGAMGASAAVSGLLAAAIPAAVSIVADGAPGLRKGAGFLVAGVAIWAIAGGTSASAEEIGQRPESASVSAGPGTMTLAVAAGIGFGLYFVLLKFAGSAGVVWPMMTARIGSLTTCGLILLGVTLGKKRARSTLVALNFRMLTWALGAALFDTSGNMLFIAATRSGRLDVAAVLASLYPASTILLAAWMLRERPSARQGWGMLIATAAVVLITL